MTMVHIEGEAKGKILLYALSTCVWCKETKKLLTELGVDFHYVYVDLLKGDEMEKVLDEMERENTFRLKRIKG
jgi:glutaredoxin